MTARRRSRRLGWVAATATLAFAVAVGIGPAAAQTPPVRAGAPFTVEAPDGTVLSEGQLPAGRAENADPSIDWGTERIPTVCVLELDLDLPERQRYLLRLPEGWPLEFERSHLAGDEPLQLLVQ